MINIIVRIENTVFIVSSLVKKYFYDNDIMESNKARYHKNNTQFGLHNFRVRIGIELK
jgi:hypothetical protein